jgi:hypothetical protein
MLNFFDFFYFTEGSRGKIEKTGDITFSGGDYRSATARTPARENAVICADMRSMRASSMG